LPRRFSPHLALLTGVVAIALTLSSAGAQEIPSEKPKKNTTAPAKPAPAQGQAHSGQPAVPVFHDGPPQHVIIDRDHFRPDAHARYEHYEFREHHFERFNDHERGLWLAGHWDHDRHNGQLGWWWFADGRWYFYNDPVYPYPLIISDVAFTETFADSPVALSTAMEVGFGREGFDYNGGTSLPRPEDCQAACNAEGRCQAWTWVQPGHQGPAPRCWLKYAAPAPNPLWWAVSGIKAPVAAPLAPPAVQQASPPPPPPQQPMWYWCDNPQGYAPYVQTCQVQWRQVPAQVAPSQPASALPPPSAPTATVGASPAPQ